MAPGSAPRQDWGGRLIDPPPDLRVVGVHLRTLQGRGLVSSASDAHTPRYRALKNERTAVGEVIEVFLDDPVLVGDLLRRVEERREQARGSQTTDERRTAAGNRTAAETITGRLLEAGKPSRGPSRNLQ